MKRLFLLFFLLSVTNLFAQTMGEWTWMKGPNTFNTNGVFGIKGLPDVANHPPALYEACSWTDTAGNFWLFGGSASSTIAYNTLWKYSIQNNTWTWMNGSNIANNAGNKGIKGVPSSNNSPSSKGYGIMTWTDKNNNLWLYGGLGITWTSEDLWKYEIATNEWTWISGPNSSSYITNYGIKGIPSPNNCPPPIIENNCTWVDNSNNLWFYGGMSESGLDYFNDLWKYDISNGLWTWEYGNATKNTPANFGQKGISDTMNNPGGRSSYASFCDNTGNFYFFGSGNNFLQLGNGGLLNDIWKYDINTKNWTWISGDNIIYSMGLYGSDCTPSFSQTPRSRFEVRSCWKDSCGLWIYGGFINNSGSTLSDFWKYDFINNNWTKISGTTNINETIVYGNYQISSSSNQPGGRAGSVSWTDKNGNLWMFGGVVNNNLLADLWRYVPDTNCINLCYTKYTPPIQVDTILKVQLIIPNFLTPNADGYNDNFNIIAKNYKNFSLKVFNRWGNMVFESNDANLLWNGSYRNNGNPCSDGVYFYLLILTDMDNKISQHKGSVTILH